MVFTQTRPPRAEGERAPAQSERETPNYHKILRVIKSEIAEEPPALDPQDEQRDFGFSYDMLIKIAEFIDLLQQRCRMLEGDKRDLIEASRADLEMANETARQWQEMSTTLKSKLDECARQLGDAKLRADSADRRSDALAKHLQTTEERAVLAESLAKSYHDRILASFGNTSRLQDMLRDIGKMDSATR